MRTFIADFLGQTGSLGKEINSNQDEMRWITSKDSEQLFQKRRLGRAEPNSLGKVIGSEKPEKSPEVNSKDDERIHHWISTSNTEVLGDLGISPNQGEIRSETLEDSNSSSN